MMGSTVKNERHDDAEINEMARRIVEQNRQKQMQQPGVVHPGGYHPMGGMQMQRPGQPMISNYFSNRQNVASTSENGLKKVEKLIGKTESWKRFDAKIQRNSTFFHRRRVPERQIWLGRI